ncbi:hypothetical protein AB3M80_02495 [Arthrospira platensis BEA 1257B]
METAFDQWWHLILGALSLNRDAFVEINILPLGRGLALTIVLVAGVSQAIGQSIVLFINRVRPFRFVLSLGIDGDFVCVHVLVLGGEYLASPQCDI